MSRKHYEVIARAILASADTADYSAREYAAVLFADVAEQDNPRFNRARFYAACGLSLPYPS